jgi:apolipoprotein N-acyltransferase
LDYEIENITSSDYELKIFLKSANNSFNRLLKSAFAKAQRRMAGFKDKELKDFKGDKDFIVLPDSYINALAVALKPTVKEIKKQILSENVTLLNGKIVSAFYKRENDLWNMTVIIRGGYKDVKYK